MDWLPFMHGWLFAGGAAAVSIPVIIHLLNRRRFHRRPWAAMQFLRESLRQNRRRLRIEELILLALRCLAVLLIAMIVARLSGCHSADALPGTTREAATVYLLDDSASMQQALGPVSMFEHARRELAQSVRKLSRSEKTAILLASDGPQTAPFFPLDYVPSPESLAVRVEALNASSRRASLADALEHARSLLADQTATKQIVLLTDCRKSDLASDADADPDGRLRKAFADLQSARIELVVMDFGRSAQTNLTVEAIELVDRYAVAGAPCRIRLTVRNNSPETVENVEITPAVLAPGEDKPMALPAQRLDRIGAGLAASIDFPVTIAHEGSAVISVQLPADDLPADSTASLAVDVRNALRVLLVDGWADATDPTPKPSALVTLTLDPLHDGSYQVRPEVVSPEAMVRATLADYDAVVLLDVADFPAYLDTPDAAAATQPTQSVYPAVRALEQYVREGGGLAIFTGPRVNTDFYNGPLLAQGRGLSPLEIGPRKGDPDTRDQYLRIDPRSIRPHGALRVFSGDAGILTRQVRFFAYNQTREPAGAAAAGPQRAEVLARFSNKAIAIAARTFGQGTVLAVYTTAGKRWNDWAADPVGTYTIFLTDMLQSIARRQAEGRSGAVPLAIAFDPPQSGRDLSGALLRTPRYPAQDVITLKPDVTTGRIEYGPTQDAGVYRMTLRAAGQDVGRVYFARNVDAAEGKLTHAGIDGLRGAFAGDEFTYVRRMAQQQIQSVTRQSKAEFLLYLVVATLIVLAAETFLAQRFGHYGRGPRREA